MNEKKLRMAMVNNDLSVPKLADILGISAQALYNKMSGRSEFTAKEIRATASAMHLSVGEINDIFFGEIVN